MADPIQSLRIEIETDGSSASKGIEALSASLGKLKTATQGGLGLTSVINNMRKMGEATKTIEKDSADKMGKLAEGLSKLGKIGEVKISSSVANQIKKIGDALKSFTDNDIERIKALSNSLEKMGTVNLQGASAQVNSMAKSVSNLNKQSGTSGSATIAQEANNTMKAGNRLNTFFTGLRGNAMNTWAMIRMGVSSVRGIGDTIGGFIAESNAYVEDLNLFNASMGKYADEAKVYAEQVGEIMGIDPGQWMRNQGIFNTILTGFGVVTDRAYTMSTQLTQLGYDISSFFNISYEDSMAKIQSGIAGELEPLRRLGYDLSVARLQQEAYALGINKSVQAMTQAEKAELRYHAIMTQVIDSHGDMARTLEAPANQMRIFQAQVILAARAIGNIFIPALNLILPYAIAAIKAIRALANEVANFFGFTLPEVDYSSLEAMKNVTAEVNDNLVDTGDLTSGIADVADSIADSAGDLGSGLGEATKQAKKLKTYMIGIDELNVLSKPEDLTSALSGGSGSGSSGKPSSGGLNDGSVGGGGLGIDLPTYDFLGDAITRRNDEILNNVKDFFAQLELIISGAMLGIGLVLVVSGANIPLGLALMVVGALGIAHAVVTNWDTIKNNINSILGVITAIVGGAILALGAVLTFTGANIPLGIGLMIAGAAVLASAVALNWGDKIPQKIKEVLVAIDLIAGTFLVVIGLLSIAGGNLPLGIGLIIAGAVSWAAAVKITWDNGLSTNIKKVLTTIMTIASGALLAIGFLVMSGGNLPLGIGLIIAGAGSLASVVAINWGNDVKANIQNLLKIITGVVGSAMLALGMIVLMSHQYTLGIGLIVAGASTLASSMAMTDVVSGKVKSLLVAVQAIASGFLIALGMFLVTTSGGLGLGLGLIAAGAVSLVTALTQKDTLSGKIKSLITTVTTIASAAFLALGAMLIITQQYLLGLGLLAAGAVSLVTAVKMSDGVSGQVKNLLTKIMAIAGGALVALGLLLCLTGVGIPLGIGMIIAGGASLASAIALNIGELANTIKNGVTKAIKAAGNFFVTIGGVLGKFFATIGTAIWNAIKAVGEVFVTIGGVLGSFFGSIGAAIWNVIKKAGEFFVNIGAAIAETPVGQFIIKVFTKIVEGVKNIAVKIGAVITTVASWIKEKFTTLVDKVKGVFVNIGAKFDEKAPEQVKFTAGVIKFASALTGVGVPVGMMLDKAKEQAKLKKEADAVVAKTNVNNLVVGAVVGVQVQKPMSETMKKIVNAVAKEADPIQIGAKLKVDAINNLKSETLDMLKKLDKTDIMFKLYADKVGGEKNLNATLNYYQDVSDKSPIEIAQELEKSAINRLKKELGSENAALQAAMDPLQWLTSLAWAYGGKYYGNDKGLIGDVTKNIQTYLNDKELLAELGFNQNEIRTDSLKQIEFIQKLFNNDSATTYVKSNLNGDPALASANRVVTNAKKIANDNPMNLLASGTKAEQTVNKSVQNMKNTVIKNPVRATIEAAIQKGKEAITVWNNNTKDISKWFKNAPMGAVIQKGKESWTVWNTNTKDVQKWLKNAPIGAVVQKGKNSWEIWNTNTRDIGKWLKNAPMGAVMQKGKNSWETWNTNTKDIAKWKKNAPITAVMANNAWNVFDAATRNFNKNAYLTVVPQMANAAFKTMTSMGLAMAGIRVFATGGFPEEGQMFIAREAGAELVGTIGNKTAVANNDQIVAAVSAGVYDAVSAAMKQGGEGGSDITINLDGEVIYKNQQKIAARKGYNFNQGAFA